MADFLYSGACSDFDRRERIQPTGVVKAGGLTDSCVRNQLGFELEEIVPDSDDDDEMGKRDELPKGTMLGDELTGEGEEEFGIVADSEEDSDKGRWRQVPDEQPGVSSQEDALKFVDHYLKCNVSELSSEGKSRSFVKPRSPLKSCVNGVKSLARRISDRTPAVGYSSYDWNDNERNVVFYSRRRKSCATIKVVKATVKSAGDSLVSVSNHQENEEVTDLSEMITGNNGNDSNLVTHAKLQKSGVDEDGGNDGFDDVFNTQMAAEVMESLLFEPPKKLNAHASRGLPKSGFETKISSSASPVRWLSKNQQLSEQKSRDAIKDLVYTYKRRRSATVRKKNKTPNIKLDIAADVKSNSEIRKEHKDLSTDIPGHNGLISLVFPKGKRTIRRSRNLRHSDSSGNDRAEGDTEKEVRCPLAKRYKPANHSHCAEPAWTKFPRKKRTSAAFNKKANIRDSFVGDAGKNSMNDDSRTFHASNSLTSVSSNCGMMTLGSCLNSAHFEKVPAKIPKYSLNKELTELGRFTDVPLYSSCKNLRRRKHVASIRVLLSQHLDNDTIMEQKKVLARLGISIATSATDATHFVANIFSRTKNMLEAIALGIPIVTQLWLESCGEAGCLVDEKSYILKDSRKEREIGFSLSSSLAKASRYPLLKDHKVFITPNIKPDKGMLSGLVKMVQGEVVDLITKNSKIPEDVIVLSCEEDYAICVPFLAKGISVYNPELLLNGIVTQKLDIQRHRLFQDGVEGPLQMLKYRSS